MRTLRNGVAGVVAALSLLAAGGAGAQEPLPSPNGAAEACCPSVGGTGAGHGLSGVQPGLSSGPTAGCAPGAGGCGGTGASVQVVNTPQGAIIHIEARDPGSIPQIRQTAQSLAKCLGATTTGTGGNGSRSPSP